MPVEQHRARSIARHFEQQHRRSSRQPNDLDGKTRYRLCARPRFRQPDHTLDMAVLFPVRIEMRRLGGDAHVFDEARNDIVVPLTSNLLGGGRNQHGFENFVGGK